MERADLPTVGRWLGWGALGVAVFIVVAAATVMLLLNRSIERVDVDGLGEDGAGPTTNDGGASGTTDPDATDADASDADDAEALTVLVLGSDSREALTPAERRELGTGDAVGERTESIMLVRLDPDADELRVLSIPRDTLITRCDGSRGRINAAYSIGERDGLGGPTCVVQTLQDWVAIRIDHVAMIDFPGFVDIVDAVGGVPIELDQPISDDDANLDLDAGCTRLDGAGALAFVRARGLDNDFGRMQRQQRFIEELRREIASVGILDDLPRLLRTADATARAMELDQTLTLNRIRILVREHRQTFRLPVEGRSLRGEVDTGSDTAFLLVDDEEARDGFEWLVQGDAVVDTVSEDATGDDRDPTSGDPDDADGRDGPSKDHVAGEPSSGTADDGPPPC